MFVASYRNTMRNAKPYVEPKVLTAEEIRIQREEAEAERVRQEVFAWQARCEAARLEMERREQEKRAWENYRVINVLPLAGEVKVMAIDIIKKVAASHGLRVQDIISQSRTKSVVSARYMAIRAVADARPDMTTPQIGRVFKRDHTSILHALAKTTGTRVTAYQGKDCRRIEGQR